MNESIQSKLALQIAQLSLDKATLEAQVEHLQVELQELKDQAEDEEGGDGHA